MKITILQSIAGHTEPRYGLADFSFPPGSIVEIDDRLGAAWIASGAAIAAKKGAALTMPPEVYTLRGGVTAPEAREDDAPAEVE